MVLFTILLIIRSDIGRNDRIILLQHQMEGRNVQLKQVSPRDAGILRGLEPAMGTSDRDIGDQ